MKDLLGSARLLLLDLASTVVFLLIVSLTRNTTLAIISAMSCGVAQIGLEFVRQRPVASIQCMSVSLVLVFGGLSLINSDPRFIMIKPTSLSM